MLFELLDRDGFGRLGRITTPHGSVRTPVLLPVIHPEPSYQVIPPSEMASRLGVEAVITSSYILRGRAELKARALAEGLHAVLGFSGTVMTDSGAFQQHVYGDVSASPSEIIEFERAIRSDISTPLDIFVEPHASQTEAAKGVEETLVRVAAARKVIDSGLLAVPIQGGLYPSLRIRSIEGSTAFADVLCFGGIVPLMEEYRFAELVRLLAAVRTALPPEKPLHLFGLGHPMLFALGALLGGDIFDTSAYHKFARRGALQFPEGTMEATAVKEDFCGCSVCAEVPLTKIAALAEKERVRHLARHNLVQCLLEIGRVRQAIRDGELWELVERRSMAHPAMRAAVLELSRHAGLFVDVEPPSRTSFRVISDLSLHRPAVLRFERKVARYQEGRGPRRSTRLKALNLPNLEHAEPELRRDANLESVWEVPTPLGSVPMELMEVYPIGSLVSPEEFAAGSRPAAPEPPKEGPAEEAAPSSPPPEPEIPITEEAVEMISPLALRHALGIVEWTWGREARSALADLGPTLRHSRSTGRLREISVGPEVLFVVGNEGLPHPTLKGGEFLHRALKAPSTRVVANSEAVPFVLEGKSLFARHVLGTDPWISPGQRVLVVDASDTFLAVGRTLLSGREIPRFSRGVAVRVTSHRHDLPTRTASPG